MGKYLGEWTCYEDMAGCEDQEPWEYSCWTGWTGAREGVQPEEVVLAAYNVYGYEGSAVCIFRRDGKLYDVYDSHCSCNGLDAFEPHETTLEALRTYEFYGCIEIRDAIRALGNVE